MREAFTPRENMAIHDSSPEKRNLSVLSLAIIIFFAAEARFLDNEVKLIVINVELHKPEVLKYFIWSMLFWFAFRYWLINRGQFTKDYFNELAQTPTKINFRYFNERLNLGLNNQDRKNHICEIITPSKRIRDVTFSYHQQTEKRPKVNQKKQKVSNFKDYLHLLKISLWALCTKPSLSGYFVPYILFCAALTLGFINWVSTPSTVLPTIQ